MNRMKSLLLCTLGMVASTENYKDFYGVPKQTPKYNPEYKPKAQHRELKEFTIKGEKITAYSRKDAIKKFNHLNRKK